MVCFLGYTYIFIYLGIYLRFSCAKYTHSLGYGYGVDGPRRRMGTRTKRQDPQEEGPLFPLAKVP